VRPDFPAALGAHTEITFTLDAAVAIALVILFTGFMLGMLVSHWMRRRR
jgi:hypothetical protein